MPDLTIRAPAKLNWFLEVVRRRDDGFHEIQTVMQTLALADQLDFTLQKSGKLSMTCDDPNLPTDASNLVLRAATLLHKQSSASAGASIHLRKRIPSGAGLGGGSSDAAATLIALNQLWQCRKSAVELAELAAQIGSDVAFFVFAHASPLAHCQGRGEKVTAIDGAVRIPIVLVWPGLESSTPTIYQSESLDRESARIEFPDTTTWTNAATVRASIFNRLAVPCFSEYPAIADTKQWIESIAAPLPVHLSGSGSAMFVVCERTDVAQGLGVRLHTDLPDACHVIVTETLCEVS